MYIWQGQMKRHGFHLHGNNNYQIAADQSE